MVIIELSKRLDIQENKRGCRKYSSFEKLLDELRKREIPSELVNSINKDIELLNSYPNSDRAFIKQLSKSQSSILKLIEKELKLVTKNHYRTLWMTLGMSVYGVPIGAGLGAAFGNMAFIGTGIPIGMAVGIGIGIALDRKAFEKGRQLDIELKN